jgi:phosphatidylinositol 3-kinase
MMCSRNCVNNLTSFDAINILDYSFKHVPYSKVFKELALAYLDKNCPDEEFKCYIPYLVYNIKYDSYNIIGQFLLNRCLKNLYLLSALYWEIQLYTDVPYLNLSKNLKHILSQDNYQPQFLKLLIGNKFVKHLESINHSIYVENKQYDDIKDEYNLSKESIVPLNIEVSVNRILLNKIKIKDSATKPIIIPCITDTGNTYKIMYKNEDVRKDQIIMNIIYLMESIVLKEEGVNLEVVRYNILPIDNRSGLIEIIDEAETVYYIQEKLKSNITNYIFENNEDSTVKSIRSKFIKSVAAYCVITYLLGIGDRHLDNIMITKDGRLFHVDFGYILGLDPVFNNPGIRITPNIIEAIGGLSSKYYVEFQELSTKIYNCLRRNIDIFMHLLLLLPKISDIGLTEEQIKNQVITRFMPGESNVNAKMHMVNQLERVNYTDQIKDWCHYYSKEKTMNSAINRLNSAISSLWYPIG